MSEIEYVISRTALRNTTLAATILLFSHCISCTVWSPASQTGAIHSWHLATLSPAFQATLPAMSQTTDIPCHCTYICNTSFSLCLTVVL